MVTALDLALAGSAAIAAGAVNALAGGGTLITFPVLTALGIPPIAANINSTVALCPGYMSATLAQQSDLLGQKRRLLYLLPAGALGGLAGAALLLATGEGLFRALVPFLILFGSALLAVQKPLRQWLLNRTKAGTTSERGAVIPIALAAVYGGYFGAGVSVIVLAVLGLTIEDTLTRLNALKQSIAFSANIAAALFLAFSGRLLVPVVLVMAAGSIIGGAIGGRLAGRIHPETLRWTVVVIGIIVAIFYWIH